MVAAAMPLMWSCSEQLDVDVDTEAPGTMTISLISGKAEEVVSRDNVGPEFYIGKTHLYFYTGNDESQTAIYHHVAEAGNRYDACKLYLNLSDDEITKIFGDTGTTCYVYAVSNLPEDIDKTLTDTETISAIKNIDLETDFTKDVDSFVMDGGTTVTLDRTNGTMKGTIWLTRAAVKISINVFLQEKIDIPGDGVYTPTSSTDANTTDVFNTVSKGKVNGTADLTDDDYLPRHSHALAPDGSSAIRKGVTYYWYKCESFYSYPSNWSDKEDKEIRANICVPWKKQDYTTGNVSFNSYYYQIAIPPNTKLKSIDRNKNYSIYVYLSVLGGTLEGEVVTPTPSQLSFEITDWTDDGANITTSLDRNHYLVVQDNAFNLYNEDTADIEYESCDDDAKVYVTEIKYHSTKDNNDYYLYNTTYNSDDNSYTEDTSGYTTDGLSQFSPDELTSIRDNAAARSSTPIVTLAPSSATDSDNGYIKFSSAVSAIAEKLYRPVVYTIVLANSKDHGMGRQTITITQYPSKYVEISDGGNVFVNGYYARLVQDEGSSVALPEGSSTNQSPYNKSYYFTYNNYNSVNNNDEYTGYYYSKSNGFESTEQYGSSETGQLESKQASVNSSYEYVRGKVTNTINFDKSIDVHVTAFTGSDNFFYVATDETGTNKEKHYYIIGDPRTKGNFIADDMHKTTAYDIGTAAAPVNRLYDYYVKGEKNGSQYRRYVQSWGDAAKDIKIAGFSKTYDDVIAPLFKLCSAQGAGSAGMTFEVAQKRCATYQEAGYPAGRWRLPTLAEIAFIINMQQKDMITTMFDTDTKDEGNKAYWDSSGGCVGAFKTSKQGAYGRYWEDYYTKDKGVYTRCVYDLWYWGTEPVTPTHVYHPMPTKQTTAHKRIKNVRRQ